MDTVAKVILLTQIPISIVILIGVYEIHKAKKELMKLLEQLAKKK
jgi:hypothetical protein